MDELKASTLQFELHLYIDLPYLLITLLLLALIISNYNF